MGKYGGSGIVIIRNSRGITLTYNNNGGSGCDSKVVLPNNAYGNLCEPTREDYIFLGWYTSEDYATMVKKNQRL